VPQPVEVDGILVPAGNRRHPRHHHFEHRVLNAVGIATIRHRFRKPPAYAKLALRLPQQQQAGIGGLVAAVKIHCDFLAMDRRQVEGKRRIVGHDGCGAGLIREATRRNTDLLRESWPLCHRRRKTSHAWCIIRVRSRRFLYAGLNGFRRCGRHFLGYCGEVLGLPGKYFELLP